MTAALSFPMLALWGAHPMECGQLRRAGTQRCGWI